MPQEVEIYDTTLRDGSQGQGVSFSVSDKLRIAERLRWNFGYQFYRYNEQFYLRDDFCAHTGYTSLLWSF